MRGRSSTANAGILTGALGLGLIVELIPENPADSAKFSGYRANAVDAWCRRTLHGGGERKSNFLDNSAGSLWTPIAGGLTIAALDIGRREFSRDIPLFIAGSALTGAITGAAKRLVARPRPYCQGGVVPLRDRAPSDPYHIQSFFSGHSSQAFFTAGFVNNRLRRHMRQEWKADEYRSWRWTSPLVCFGWASFVGLSRIQADKHHFTDVAVGAMAGYAVSELFYRLCYESGGVGPADEGPAMLLAWRFPL